MGADVTRRVLITADTVGGVWSYTLELASALAQRGIAVDVASMGSPVTRMQRGALAAVASSTLHESGYRLEWMEDAWDDVADAGEWLLDLERTIRPDVVHLNQFAFGGLPFRAPKVVVAHSCVLSWWRAVHGERPPEIWTRYAHEVGQGLRGADLVVAPTKAMLDTLRDNYAFSGKALVIPNARDAGAYRPGRKEPFVFAAGRLWDDAKNLAALDAVASRLPWPVRVAGPLASPDGHVRMPAHVEVLGERSPADIAFELARASIYAFPARYEPFGLSILEAGLAGCALVLGDIASLREVWGDAALYVPPDDHGRLRETLLGLIADGARREALAGRARRVALRHAPERMLDGYLEAYRRVLRSTRTRRALLNCFPPEVRA